MEKLKEVPLTFDEIFVGQKIKDEAGDFGVIEKIENIFNIHIRYVKNGYGISCLNGCCSDRLYQASF